MSGLTFWWWDGNGQIWADAYNKLNRGATVKFVNTPFADSHDKLLTSFASGTGAPDIASARNRPYWRFHCQGRVVRPQGCTHLMAASTKKTW
jgi:ABC-type glycerol-3-phosphate transport system substrate-binding protein